MSDEPRNSKYSFYNNMGVLVNCLPIYFPDNVKLIADIEKKYRESGEPIEPPTYEIPVQVGEEDPIIEVHQHNETTLQTEEDISIWAKHKNALSIMNKEILAATIRLFILRGIDWGKHEISQTWKSTQKAIGYSIPDDLYELRIRFATDQLIVGWQDENKLRETCLRAYYDGAPQEAVDAMIGRLFRYNVEKGNNRNPAI